MLRGHASGDYIAGDTGQDMIRDLRGIIGSSAVKASTGF